MLTPGQHLLCKGSVSDIFRMRQSGMSLRDSLVLLCPKGHAQVVGLFRVPLEVPLVDTILSEGSGALHLEPCRVSVPGTIGGRWPTNVILVHSPGCAEGCASGCPVPILDQQGGLRTSGTGAIKKETSAGFQGAAYGKENRAAGTEMLSYGDTGSAARYYPRLKSHEEAEGWLSYLLG